MIHNGTDQNLFCKNGWRPRAVRDQLDQVVAKYHLSWRDSHLFTGAKISGVAAGGGRLLDASQPQFVAPLVLRALKQNWSTAFCGFGTNRRVGQKKVRRRKHTQHLIARKVRQMLAVR